MRFAGPTLYLTCVLMLACGPAVAQPPRPTPQRMLAQAEGTPVPHLVFTGQESYQVGERRFTRYRYDVRNKALYPANLFAAAPNLPPCGANTNSSRTWVDFFGPDGGRIYGFCALGNPAQLNTLWFALPEGQAPPFGVYVEMRDRQTNTLYPSNLAPTAIER